VTAATGSRDRREARRGGRVLFESLPVSRPLWRDEAAELELLLTMPARSSRESSTLPAECASEFAAGAGVHAPGSAWASSQAEHSNSKQRLSTLARTLEADVIPRLVGAHRKPAQSAAKLSAREVERFVDLLRNASDAEIGAAVAAFHRRGLSVQAIFLEAFAPAARYLGELWVADRCDFSTVTVCLGRLQRLLREWSPAFGTEVEHPPNGRRILLAQHPDEQHSFGLSMVAEFFRRDGWEVLGGVGGAVPDPSSQVARDWFDAIGFSVGSETRLDWLRERIAQVRASTRNRGVVVLVGGPLFVLHPEWVQSVGADAAGHAGGQAPQLTEELLAIRHARR
jgi:MerR family transcriptional regulator, light-induced transcriptional regulator